MGYLEALEPKDGRRRFKLRSPKDGHEVGTFVVHNADDVATAVATAREAQKTWGALTVKQRAKHILKAVDVMLAHKDDYIARMTAETGRATLDTLMIEVFAALDSMNFYSRNAPKLLADRGVGLHLLKMKKAKLVYQPLGVVAVISPWNGPFILSLNPAVQAMLAGNTVIIKPSEVTPFSGLLVEELFREAGLPQGVLQVLTGDGETGAALIAGGVNKVTFTGSVATGRKVGVACAEQLIPCTLELGGKDPMVICADADLERAAGGAIFGSLMNSGQFCSSTERIYVVKEVADAFIAKVCAKVDALELGRDLGPFIFERQCAIVARHVDEAVAAGAKVLRGGKAEGNYYLPTVITDLTHDMALMTEETFGPVIAIKVVADEAEAIAMANDSEFGLGASVWSKDLAKAERLARQLHAGAIVINDSSITYGALELPFGGRKSSGIGRTNGVDALYSYTHPTPIIRDRFGQKEEAVWYPYTQDKTDSLMKALGVIWGSPLKWFMK